MINLSTTHTPSPARPSTRATNHSDWREFLKPFASLRITVTLLALCMILVFAGTWAQLDVGVWVVQKRYFHSFWTWIGFGLFMPRAADGSLRTPLGFPMPGGYLLGILLLTNLLSAYISRFRLTWRDIVLIPAVAASITLGWIILGSSGISAHFLEAMGWQRGGVYYLLGIFCPLVLIPMLLAVVPLHRKRSGVILIHLGVLLLIVGEGVTSRLQRESQMVINVGESTYYAEDVREVELAVTDTTPADHDDAVIVSQKRLEQGGLIQWKSLPFDIHLDEYHTNSRLLGPMQVTSANAPKATQGSGTKVAVLGIPKFTGTEEENIDQPAAYITLTQKDGASLGTYLLISNEMFPDFSSPQEITAAGKHYTLQLRFKRAYKPYSIQLLEFSHDTYTGTDTARNFASRIRLVDPTAKVDRNVLVRMNEPLRYAGETFYQYQFRTGDKTSILQVVQNPGWLMPYIACAVGAAGLTIHFSITLLNFLRKRQKISLASATPKPAFSWSSAVFLLPATVVVIAGMYILSRTHSVTPPSDYDIDTFARLPISYEGRTLPMDSLARNSLKVIAGRERIEIDSKPKPPVEWLLDVLARPDQAVNYPVFRIDNQELQSLLQLDPKQKWFSLTSIFAHQKELQREMDRASAIDSRHRDAFDRAVLELATHARLYIRLAQLDTLYTVPPAKAGTDWRQLGDVMAAAQTSGDIDPSIRHFVGMLQGYHEKQPDNFNAEAAAYRAILAQHVPVAIDKASFETWFNRFDPFMQCMALYVGVFLLAAGSWLTWTRPLARAALWLLGLTLLLHTFGLASRIYISGRPPVTNLASSAIFIAWGGVLLASGLEIVWRNGIGCVAAAVMGFTSLLISDRLSLTGDTMQVLQAVLDTNFWLATHVVCITMGYAATFLAGMLAAIFVLRGMLTRSLQPDDIKTNARMVYGIVCFAILFSFVGTILGGIWADQSWGRFWGWDPKENGAVLIVLWNAISIHARWGGIVRDRGVMLMAIFGNVVTAWSWFGTNMLGVGLHSYGFMDSAMFWLVAFVSSQIALILLGNIPIRFWRSFSSPQVIAAS